MRLDKFLSNNGVGTRKEVKNIIRKGFVKINGVVIKDDDHKINENSDKVSVYDEYIAYQKYYYIMMNKDKNCVCANEDNLNNTVFDYLDFHVNDLHTVGRLDKDTTGLLLITNDGNLTHNLLAPKKHVSKVYRVKLIKEISDDDIKKLAAGIMIDGNEMCKPAFLERTEDPFVVYLTIYEGKFHQVKRMFLALDNEVIELHRVKMGPLTLDEELSLGDYRFLTSRELELLDL